MARRARIHITGAALAGLIALTVPRLLAAPQDRPAGRQGPYAEDTPGLTKPKVTHSVKATYTPEAMRQKIQGEVDVAVVVDATGKATDVHVIKSLDTQYGLDDSAVRAARAWTFEPGRLDGKAVPVTVTVTTAFRLH